MDYEARGRYEEATEKAKSAAIDVRNAFAQLGRLTLCLNVGSETIACEYDFSKIRAAVEEAQSAQVAMLVEIAKANHEAIACEKPSLRLYNALKN
ncbi:hypothetical protein [Propionivibrio sp.]|uniref:hypothetical protein n=1 Tax=Propionivibrio sp. TaxID=2212460 RepID=UPI003BF127EE